MFSCSLRGPQPRGRFSSHDPYSSFYSFFVSFFQTSFLTAIKPKSPKNGSSQTAKNHKKLQKKVTETHPQSGPVKRLSLAGAKPLKLTTLTTLSAVFPKAQSSQSRAKMEAKMRSSGTQNHEKSKRRAPQKTLKKRPRKVGPGLHFGAKNGIVFRGGLVPILSLGPSWGQNGPRAPPRAPRMVPDTIFNDF